MFPCSCHGHSLGTTRKHEPGHLVTNVVNDPALTPHGGVLQVVFNLNTNRGVSAWPFECKAFFLPKNLRIIVFLQVPPESLFPMFQDFIAGLECCYDAVQLQAVIGSRSCCKSLTKPFPCSHLCLSKETLEPDS
jgi:hypothetical protein